MSIKEKKTILPKKNSLEYIVLLYILEYSFKSSIMITLEINRIKKRRYYYKIIQRTMYRLREKRLIQCYGQRWKVTSKIRRICKISPI